MVIVIKPEDWTTGTASSNSTLTWTTYSTGTATTKDVEMSNAEHQVHVTSDDNEEIIVECWTCPGFPQLKKLGKNPAFHDVYSVVYAHWNA